MPIPLIFLGGAAVVAAYTAWTFRKEIAEFFDSEEGKKLLAGVGQAMEGAMEPYKKMLDESYGMETARRRAFFAEAKKRMSRDSWAMLVGYSKGLVQREPKYIAVGIDLLFIDGQG